MSCSPASLCCACCSAPRPPTRCCRRCASRQMSMRDSRGCSHRPCRLIRSEQPSAHTQQQRARARIAHAPPSAVAHLRSSITRSCSAKVRRQQRCAYPHTGCACEHTTAAKSACANKQHRKHSRTCVFDCSAFRDVLATTDVKPFSLCPAAAAMTFSSHSGLTAGETAMSSGNFDFVVASSSVSDVYAASNPTVRSYPIMASALAPSYALPASAGNAKLKLTTVTLCKMWRGEITHWSVAGRAEQSKS